MTGGAPDLVVIGQVLLGIANGRPRTAGGVAIAGGRIVAAGVAGEVRDLAGRGTRVIDEPGLAVVPGLHDFHLHLVGMARARREVRLDGLLGDALVSAVTAASRALSPGEWLRGRGWSEDALKPPVRDALEMALSGRPALLYSHDAHSAWVSAGARAAAGLSDDSADPQGGRLERDAGGGLTGVLRERATDLAEVAAGRLRGPALDVALDETVAELAAWGVTGASDAGDTSAENGSGASGALGDRASLLLAAGDRLDGRLRLAVGFPADAIEAAAGLGLATGQALPGRSTLRAGWAKAYADGALGSRTAALFEPYTCGPPERGILRLTDGELDGRVAAARVARIGLAIHAIGDRAVAAVLDALERGPSREAGVPPDRIEHLQLMRAGDAARLAAADVTASVQPVHCAADRNLVEACWADRAALAYPWRTLADAGARLAFGSDAPIETPNPWLGVYAAQHRRMPRDGTADWQSAQALAVAAALEGYTRGPATAAGRGDEGHLDVGAHADLSVMNMDLATILAGGEELAEVRSQLTLVGGAEVHRS
jgi:predicted amidohydrolase YtcJ